MQRAPAKLLESRFCLVCGAEFKPRTSLHTFCTTTCKGKWKYLTGVESTEKQYKKISGNWYRYCARLLGRRKGRGDLTINQLLELLKQQDYKCALSGVDLTCQLEKGVKCKTNASLDRIKAGEPYTMENIQFVCAAVNSWRADTDLDEFIWFCKKITAWQEKAGQ